MKNSKSLDWKKNKEKSQFNLKVELRFYFVRLFLRTYLYNVSKNKNNE